MAHAKTAGSDFPCSITISIPFPTRRLASIALEALRVDIELSSLVTRTFSLSDSAGTAETGNGSSLEKTGKVLHVKYSATINRMLRVAVNGFMESLGAIMEVMEQLDKDLLNKAA